MKYCYSIFLLFFIGIQSIFSAPPSGPMLYQTLATLPNSVFTNSTTVIHYRLTNQNIAPIPYHVTLNSPYLNVATGNSCALNSTIVLAAHASCDIYLNFNPGNNPGNYNNTNAISVSTANSYAFPLATNILFANNFIFFGDSLTDTGNSGYPAATNPDPSLGRRVWAQELLNLSGINDTALQIASQLPTTTSANNVNVNFAVQGATTANLAGQISLYSTDLRGQTPNTHSKIFLWMGGNDLFASTNPSAITTAVNNMKNAVASLIAMGISQSNIYVLNLPNLGDTPQAKHAGRSTELSNATNNFNSQTASKLNSSYPHVHIIDIYQLLYSVVHDSGHHGFSDIADTCSGSSAAPSCTGFLYWDTIHPTVQAHTYAANYIWSVIK